MLDNKKKLRHSFPAITGFQVSCISHANFDLLSICLDHLNKGWFC